MAICITNDELEKRLAELGQRQRIPVKKSTMAEAILRAAVGDDRGKPRDKWYGRAHVFAKADTTAAP